MGNTQDAAKDKLLVAIQSIESARGLEPRSAELELSATRVYALASVHASESADEQRQRLDKACIAGEAAVDLGLSPQELNELKELADYAPPLKEHPRFQEILNKKPSSETPAPTGCQVDLFPAIRDRLLELITEKGP
jgi:hypothetical protein